MVRVKSSVGSWTRMALRLGRGVRRFGGAAALFGALALAALPAGAYQPEPGAKAAAPKENPKPIVVIERAPLSEFLVDKRDQGLRAALAMVPARLRELSREAPELADVPPSVVDLLVEGASHPGRMALTYNAADKTAGGFGLGVVLSVGPVEKAEADRMHGKMNGLLASREGGRQPKPSEAAPGMMEMYAPLVGRIRYGPRQAKDGWRYEVHLASAGDADAAFELLPAPAMEGFKPLMRARVDLSGLTPLVDMRRAMGGNPPEAERVVEALKKQGIIGPDAVKYTFQAGYAKDEIVKIVTAQGLRKFATGEATGADAAHVKRATEPLADTELRMIPADAFVGGVARMSLAPVRAMIEEARAADEQVGRHLDEFKEKTGVDPVEDVLGSMGEAGGWYMSDSTGGSLMSLVGFVALAERAKFAEANAKLTRHFDGMLADEEAHGYVRLRGWCDGEAQFFSLTFPGLPVPIEPTYTIAGDWLIVAMSPQAALAAARQAMGHGDRGLTENRAIAPVLARGKGVVSVGFVDTARTMKDGYQYVALIGSALANAVRSPEAAEREPGLVVPIYGELKAGARPIVTYSYWRDDDLVTEAHGDRSILVNWAGLAGVISPFVPVFEAIGAVAGAQRHRLIDMDVERDDPVMHDR